MTNEFNVIGERKDDDLHLLVRGDDGQHYDYSLASERVSPVEPDERWEIDPSLLDESVLEDGGVEGGDWEPGGETPIG